jgi:ferredoxin like protein
MVTTTLDEKMRTVRFKVHATAHIVLDAAKCRTCESQACIYACPANLFVPLDDGSVLFNYEHCFECGTCFLVCSTEGALTWSYPVGGFGVTFRES